MRKKIFASAAVYTACMLSLTAFFSGSIDAEETDEEETKVLVKAENHFEDVKASYGDRTDCYLYQESVEDSPVYVIISDGGKAYTYTKTNIREHPSERTASLAVIPSDAEVLIWGYCENGWTKVFHKGVSESGADSSGSPADDYVTIGYIKSDLLMQ